MKRFSFISLFYWDVHTCMNTPCKTTKKAIAKRKFKTHKLVTHERQISDFCHAYEAHHISKIKKLKRKAFKYHHVI